MLVFTEASRGAAEKMDLSFEAVEFNEPFALWTKVKMVRLVAKMVERLGILL